MFGKTYYHDTLRKYVILFGTLFNDIWINREDQDGNVKQSLKIPLSYGPREKFLARIEDIQNRDPLQQPFATILPRMGFEITGFNYSPERKLPTRNKFSTTNSDNSDQKKYQYNPVPYDIQFSLSIFCKNTTDGTRIIEQILPFFTPEWTSTVELITDPQVVLDIPLVLTGVNQDDVYEGSFEDRRSLIWTLDFTMKGFFFGPTYKQDVIKLANTQIFDASLYDDIDLAVNNVDTTVRITNQPGLTANNEPTKYSSDNILQATAIASIQNGYVSGITVIEQGLGYSQASITITGDGANAEATAIVGPGNYIDRIEITNGGSGYTSTPTVTISAPDLVTIDKSLIESDDNYGNINIVDGPYPDFS